MAKPSVHQQNLLMEVNRVDPAPDRRADVVNRVDRLPDLTLEMAKVGVGSAVREAIGRRPLKEFGDKGLVSGVCSGDKAPDYLARIYQDPQARRRFALALLEDDHEVHVDTVIRIPLRKKLKEG